MKKRLEFQKHKDQNFKSTKKGLKLPKHEGKNQNLKNIKKGINIFGSSKT